MRALALALLTSMTCAHAQSIEPRAYSNAPVGTNFLLVGYAYSKGGVGFDSAVPLENGEARIHSLVTAYVRTLDVAGQSGSLALLLPVARFSGSATFEGVEASRDVTGLGDPGLRLSVNLHGAPALNAAQFAQYRQDLIVGASLSVSAPLGQYDPERLVNLGTNRWSAKPELGLSKALGPWTVELMGNVTWFSRNDEFFHGNTREQEPIYSTQLHLIRQFGRGLWGAASVSYYEGGRTSLNGVAKDDRQSGSRFGLTFTMPLARQQSLKLFAHSGLYARTGADFDTIGVSWQYFWGEGM
jgi:hypothetical protein